MVESKKKAQAALEFLTTYGWAFLVIIVMIGALAYFGVLDPGRFVADSCKLDGSIECNAIAVNSTDTTPNSAVAINIKNNLDKDIAVSRIEIGESSSKIMRNCLISPAVPISKYSSEDVMCILDNALADTSGDLKKGVKKKFDILIYYSVGTSTFEKLSSGAATTTLG